VFHNPPLHQPYNCLARRKRDCFGGIAGTYIIAVLQPECRVHVTYKILTCLFLQKHAQKRGPIGFKSFEKTHRDSIILDLTLETSFDWELGRQRTFSNDTALKSNKPIWRLNVVAQIVIGSYRKLAHITAAPALGQRHLESKLPDSAPNMAQSIHQNTEVLLYSWFYLKIT